KLEEYKKNIKKIKAFLNGKTKNVVKTMQKEQAVYVKNENFEKAGEIQKQIEQIELITSEFYEPFHYVEKPRFYFERLAKEVRSLKRTLNKYGLDVGNLERIECFDISNLQGRQATGSMVVLHNGDVTK